MSATRSTLLLALLTFAAVPFARAAPTGITGMTLTNGNPANATAEGTLVTAFTVPSGTYANLSAASSTTATGATSLRPLGAAANPSGSTAIDLDVSNGLANIGTSDVFFGSLFNPLGAPGAGNDIFLFELGTAPGSATAGDDAITVQGLDAGNNLIGTPLSIAVADWGNTGKTGTYTTSGTNSLTRNIAGIAFDVEDLNSGGALPGLVGIRITNVSGALDPLAVGYTVASAPVPEPASLAALGLGAVALLKRRKRG